MALGVLHIGIKVNNIDAEAFLKFKSTVVEIPGDEKVKSVCQPYRRISIPLESQVYSQLRKLVKIEEVKTIFAVGFNRQYQF